jgi:hypothetical protein
MVEEELQAPERRLRAAIRKSCEMSGAEKPMTIDGAEEFKVARRERHRSHQGALEAGPAGLRMGHRESA